MHLWNNFSKSGENSATEVLVGVDCLKNDVGRRYAIEKFVVHPNYKRNPHGSDIALVKIKGEMALSDQLRNIRYSSEEVPDEADVSITSWDRADVSDSRLILSKSLKKNLKQVYFCLSKNSV